MNDGDLELKIGTKVLPDGDIGFAVFRGDDSIGQKVMSQDDAASMAAHLLNAASAAHNLSRPKPLGGGHDIHPTAISLAQSTEGAMLMVLWFGEGGISFPLEPDMAKQLFAAVGDAGHVIKKH